MARHRAPRASRWFRRQPVVAPTAGPTAGPAPAEPLGQEDRVLIEELPTPPREMQLDYPDGSRLTAAAEYLGHQAGRERWLGLIPPNARLVNGMVVRLERDTVLAVQVREREYLRPARRPPGAHHRPE